MDESIQGKTPEKYDWAAAVLGASNPRPKRFQPACRFHPWESGEARSRHASGRWAVFHIPSICGGDVPGGLGRWRRRDRHGNRFRRIGVGRAWPAMSMVSDDRKGGRCPPYLATLAVYQLITPVMPADISAKPPIPKSLPIAIEALSINVGVFP